MPGTVLVAIGLAASCGGAPAVTSPSAGVSLPSGLAIVFDDPAGVLAGRAAEIREGIATAYSRASPQISIAGVTATASGDLGRVIPGWGIGGFAHGPAHVELAVDPRLDAGLLAERLPRMSAHEFHHVARFRGPGYGGTLLEALVSEGLADHFAIDLMGGPAPPWATALSPGDLERWLDRARAEFDSRTYDHGAWFVGRGSIPVWAGYAIGFELVRRHRAAHPGTTAASLVNTPAAEFRPD